MRIYQYHGFSSFTFQYVSINTTMMRWWRPRLFALHSNMFLLILVRVTEDIQDVPGFTFQYVSINTNIEPSVALISSAFTFQYVSINTFLNAWEKAEHLPLHSNMFLLIQIPRYTSRTWKLLYIPICFY